MTKQALFCSALALSAVVGVACKKNTPDTQPLQPTPGYPTATAYPTATMPTATTATTGLPPGPLSPACSTPEGTCGYARCNMQASRCAFPCNGPQDCIQGSQCIGIGTPVAFCGPTGIPGMTPAQ